MTANFIVKIKLSTKIIINLYLVEDMQDTLGRYKSSKTTKSSAKTFLNSLEL